MVKIDEVPRKPYFGGRFELLSIDVGKQISVYDIKEAYPWLFSNEIRLGPLKVFPNFDDKDELV